MESPYVSFCVPPAGSSSSLESSQVIMALALHLAARRSCLCSLSAVQPPPHGKICAIYRVFSLESCCAMWCCFLFRKTFISSYLCNPISFLSNLMILLSLLSIFRFFKNLRWNSGKETFVDVMVLLMNLVFSFLFFFFKFSSAPHCSKTCDPTLEAWSLNHWTCREVPFLSLFKIVYD